MPRSQCLWPGQEQQKRMMVNKCLRSCNHFSSSYQGIFETCDTELPVSDHWSTTTRQPSALVLNTSATLVILIESITCYHALSTYNTSLVPRLSPPTNSLGTRLLQYVAIGSIANDRMFNFFIHVKTSAIEERCS